MFGVSEEDVYLLLDYGFSVDEIEEMGLADVESEGIYQNASENVKKIMNGFLSEFKDYEIVYM